VKTDVPYSLCNYENKARKYLWAILFSLARRQLFKKSSTRGSAMEEPGEQCTVVFALIVTEPASEAWEGCYNPTLLLALRNNIFKDDSALFSRFDIRKS
jgi:hypothetical protein